MKLLTDLNLNRQFNMNINEFQTLFIFQYFEIIQ